MEDIKDKKTQTKPKLYISYNEELGGDEVNYSGALMLITKDEMRKKADYIKTCENKINTLLSGMDMAKKEIQRLRSELDASQRENEKLKGRLESFTSYQGNGRPPVLSEEHKKVIKALYGKKMTVSDIHKALILKFGFKGNYETVRKYIRDSENAKAWQ